MIFLKFMLLLSVFLFQFQFVQSQLKDDFYTDWVPKNVYTLFEGEKGGVSENYKLHKDEKKLGISFWIYGIGQTSAPLQIFEATATNFVMRAVKDGPSAVKFYFQINDKFMECIAGFMDELDVSGWSYFFAGVSFPRWEGFGLLNDMKSHFAQTQNGSCYFSDFADPEEPNNTYLAKSQTISINVPNFYKVKRLTYNSDFFPISFFGLVTDFNPEGTKLLHRYLLPKYLDNKLVDFSDNKEHVTISPSLADRDNLIIQANYLEINDVNQKLGLSYTLAFWLKVIPIEFVESFQVVSLYNKQSELLYSLEMLDLKKIASTSVNAQAFPRHIPTNKWIHMTIHSYADKDNLAWVQTSIFRDNDTFSTFPYRHYEKVEYVGGINQDANDYTLVIGDKFRTSEEGRFSFLMDDLVILKGGTIMTHESGPIDHCITHIGFNELNEDINSTRKSDLVCVLCEEGYVSMNKICIASNDCTIKDEEKRICKDITMEDIDEGLAMQVEYVRLLQNGHQIKITIPGLLSLKSEQEFDYAISGLDYPQEFNAQPRPPAFEGGYLVNVTFKETQNDYMPLKIDFKETNFVILSGEIELPPVSVVSDEFVDTVDSVVEGVITTVVTAGIASAFGLTLLGQMGPVFGLLDLLQIITLMVYINAPYPIHVEIFFDRMMVTQMEWLPNWTQNFVSNILDSLIENYQYIIEDQEAEGRFNFKELTSSFMVNGGQLLTFQLMLVVVSSCISYLRKIFAGRINKLAIILGKFEKLMDINFFIRGYQSICLPMTIAVAIQINNISDYNVINIVSAGLAFVSLLYMCIITYYIYKISASALKVDKGRALKTLASKFSAVFEGFNLKEKWGPFYFVMVFFKKYLLIYFLAYFQAVPEFQIAALIVIYIANVRILWKNRPFLEKQIYQVASSTEFLLLIAHFLAASYIYNIAVTPKARDITGWIIIVILIVTIVINLALLIKMQIQQLLTIKQQAKKLYLRIRNLFKQKKNSSRIKRVGTPNFYKIKRRERLNQEEVKVMGFYPNVDNPAIYDPSHKGTLADEKLRTSMSESENYGAATPSRGRRPKIRRTNTSASKKFQGGQKSEAGSVRHQETVMSKVSEESLGEEKKGGILTERKKVIQKGRKKGFFERFKIAISNFTIRNARAGQYKEKPRDLELAKKNSDIVINLEETHSQIILEDEKKLDIESHKGTSQKRKKKDISAELD